MNEKVLQELIELDWEKEKAALATIIRTTGSTPRGAGAQMVVYPDGRTVGTIGGGCGEAEVKRAALMSLDIGNPCLYRVSLDSVVAAEAGMVCGGNMDVFIEPVRDATPFQQLASYWQREEPVVSLTVVRSNKEEIIGQRSFIDLEGRGDWQGPFLPAQIKEQARRGEYQLVDLSWPEGGGEVEVFVHPVLPVAKLLVLGAGYVGQAVARLAGELDFRTTVVDDRVEFANRHNLPTADEIICDSFPRVLSRYRLTANTYVVIVTRGHRSDEECLKLVINSPGAYIGMIGSRRKIKLLFENLVEQGISREVLKTVHSPIGLDIGAETPAEIAISILAEIIQVRRGHNK